jgi:hypothetical protein
VGFSAETEDVGPGGCMVISPRPLPPGVSLRLAIDVEGIPDRLSVLGLVAWAQQGTRSRAGVAFARSQPGGVSPQAWFQRMVQSQPGLAARMSRAPDKLWLDRPVYLLAPPRYILDFSDAEASLLRRIDNGQTPRQLGDGLPVEAVGKILFGLFEKRALTLALGESVPAWRWREVLDRASGGAPAPRSPASPPGRAPAPPLLRPVPAPFQAPASAVRPANPADLGARRGTRPQEAQECLDRALAASAEGHLHTAISLLRRALQLAPRDAEIAEALGKLAFRGRGG